MRSAVKPDSLEAALREALRRFDGASPVTDQVHYHFNGGEPARFAQAQPWMGLVLAVAERAGAEPEDALDAACAVAILQSAAALHAEVGTESGPSVPARFGLAHGINAGDAICALAYLQLLAGSGGARPAERTVAMTRALLEANYALCAGTAGALLGGACELGALAAGVPAERARAFSRAARRYGDVSPGAIDVARLCSEAACA